MRLALPLAFLFAAPACSAPAVLAEWTFDDGETGGWAAANHISDLTVANGALGGTIVDWDPFLRSPEFYIKASPWQRIEFRLKTNDTGGQGEFFWTNTTESAYGGFSPGKETLFQVIGDNQWHTYQVHPFWHAEGSIILLRLDLPRPAAGAPQPQTFELDWIRIVDLGTPDTVATDPNWEFTGTTLNWESVDGGTVVASPRGLVFTPDDAPAAYLMGPPMKCPVGDRVWLSIDMALDPAPGAAADAGSGLVRFVSSEASGLQTVKFTTRPDGRFHTYNVDLTSSAQWRGDILALGLTPSLQPGARATIRRIVMAEDPQGGPEVNCTSPGLEDAISRAGRPARLVLRLSNTGGARTDDLRIASLTLPPGVAVTQEGDWRALPVLEPFDQANARIALSADQPMSGPFSVTLTGAGAPAAPITGQIEFLPSPNLPRADYVPEPQPLQSDYEIGALYFPGWPGAGNWEPIIRDGPERKPVLGWYNEANPECVDWQIKWAVENGISFFMVDWYWSKGGRSLEHWVQAFKKARYRSYLKWCMMWANHNGPGSHSEEDQRAVTRYWIDNLFNMPEYYRINDMPVVMIWSPDGMEADMAGKGGCKRLLDISQEMAREAGYKGIWFVAMKWPEGSTDPQIIQALADKGFQQTSIYHYMDSGGRAQDWTRFPFDYVADSSYEFWKAWNEAGILPFLPNLSTGWDNRPWAGEAAQVIYGRTVDKFRRICTDARRFADETGIKRMVLAPLNEWGEGSYAEPCKESGFGMYEAVRETFCRQPETGWPLNYAPADVGLGPYDLLGPTQVIRTTWDFSDGMQDFSPFMGIQECDATGGTLRILTSSSDPALNAHLSSLLSSRFSSIVVRMKIDSVGVPGEQAQLFWSTTTAGISEEASAKFELIPDGEFHDYVLPVAQNTRWKGRLRSFRFDPCSHSGAHIEIDEIRLVPVGE